MPPRVVVVGGGVAGLVAAYELERHGLTAHVLEASDAWGGRVQTVRYEGGLEAEYGLQELWEGNPLLDLARDLGVPLDGEPAPAYSSLVLDGRVVPFIQDTTEAYFASFLDPKERTALDRFMERARALYAEARARGLASASVAALQERSFARWLEEERLPPRAARWVRLTLECELGASAEVFSALSGLLELHLFFDPDTRNYHVRGGNSRLVEALAGALTSKKTLSARVTSIRRWRRDDGAVRVAVTYLHAGEVKTVEAERVIVAVPFTRLHQVHFDPPLSPERWAAINTLSFGRYTVVHFLMDRTASPLWTVEGVDVTPVLTDGPLGVVYGVQQSPPEASPTQVFGLLVYKNEAASFHMAPADRKAKELLEALDRLWPGFSKHVRSTHVYPYHPAALAVWPVGRSPLDAKSELIRTPELGTALAGDWTLGSHSDHAARSGLEVARRIAAELGATRRDGTTAASGMVDR